MEAGGVSKQLKVEDALAYLDKVKTQPVLLLNNIYRPRM